MRNIEANADVHTAGNHMIVRIMSPGVKSVKRGRAILQ